MFGHLKLNQTGKRHLQTGDVPRVRFFAFCLTDSGIIGFNQRKRRNNGL
jgi:hypothetical protein